MELDRFLQAQEDWYDYALKEVKSGNKRSHWMWFIFPQITGLGRSDTARYFAIQSREEAIAYLAHPVLGPRLKEISAALLEVREVSTETMLGYTDSVKLRSSMTLFYEISGETVFRDVLEKYYGGKPDPATLEILRGM